MEFLSLPAQLRCAADQNRTGTETLEESRSTIKLRPLEEQTCCRSRVARLSAGTYFLPFEKITDLSFRPVLVRPYVRYSSSPSDQGICLTTVAGCYTLVKSQLPLKCPNGRAAVLPFFLKPTRAWLSGGVKRPFFPLAICSTSYYKIVFRLAAPSGFEPKQTLPESVVLPLYYGAPFN